MAAPWQRILASARAQVVTMGANVQVGVRQKYDIIGKPVSATKIWKRNYMVHCNGRLVRKNSSLSCRCIIFSRIETTVHIMLFNSLRPRRNRRHFTNDIFNCISLNEHVLISIKVSLTFIPKGLINNIPLSEPMVVSSLLTRICVIQPQWVKS